MQEINIMVETIKKICSLYGVDIKREIAEFKAAGYTLSRETEELPLAQ